MNLEELSSHALYCVFLLPIHERTQVRVRLYVWSVMSEDIETQQKGVVGIAELRKDMFADMSNKQNQADYKALLDALPVRFSAVHLILNFSNSHVTKLIKSFVVLGLFGSNERVRTKCYEGLSTQTHYELLTYGIPVQDIPLTSGGNIKTKNLLQWVKTRKSIDKFRQNGDHGSAAMIITHPSINDVLFSRGGNPQHPGNREFHQFLTLMHSRYSNAVHREETENIRNELIRSVIVINGRFLEVHKTGGWWEEITDLERVHFKINNAFYDYNRKLKAIQNQQTSASATSCFLEANKRRKIDETGGCF